MKQHKEYSIHHLLEKIQSPAIHDASNENDIGFGTVRKLLRHVVPVYMHERSVDVLDRFVNDEALQVVAIVDNEHRVVGIIDREKISETFLKPYARDLLGKKQIHELMDRDPIVVDVNAGIDDVAQIIIDSGMRRHLMNGFIIEEHGIYAGMATGLSLLEEITHRRQRELFMLAHYDQLTGLPNRLLFKDRLTQACENASRNGKMAALIFVDVDRFKFINDSLGHSAGDRLLRIVADRLVENVRKSDTVARLGGDEFVVILQNIAEPAEVQQVALQVVNKLRQPVTIFEHELQISASMGGALYPRDTQSVDDLIRKADMAMYAVKQSGRNNFIMFSPEMENKTEERISFESQLRKAVVNGELSLHYQPQIDLRSNSVIGVEVLSRWLHPELGYISPTIFISIAEEIGLIEQIGEWVLTEAVKQHKHWIERGLPPIRMAVNVSAVQFQMKGFPQKVRRIVDQYGIDPSYLELELTESGIMRHAEETIRTLMDLRALGVKLAIDDFGTGYSCLSYLREFPIDRIKIDQSFIKGIKNTPANAAIVKAIIALCESLGLQTLAEGVEEFDDLQRLISYNCMEAQGYYFTKALAAEDLVVWYKNKYPSATDDEACAAV